jgi:hypothetical protein
MSSLTVLAASAGVVTVAASAAAIATLATAVRATAGRATTVVRRQHKRAEREREATQEYERVALQLELVRQVASRRLLESEGGTAEARAAVTKYMESYLDSTTRSPQESELLSQRLRDVARDLEAEADSIAVGVAEQGKSDNESGSSPQDGGT